MEFKIFRKSILVILLLVISFSYYSCTPQKKLRYLQQQESLSVVDSLNTAISANEYRIKPDDQLHISIFSNNSELLPATLSIQQSTSLSNDLSAYISSYVVNDSGIIEIPLIGDFEVAGKTIKETKKIITNEVRKKYSLDAEINIKLLNFRISVIGEVQNPGVIQVYNTKINILEAIAMAGDLTTYGNRKNIMIVRESNQQQFINYVDISSSELINSDSYYIQPGDVIYVQSLDAKTYGFAQVQWGVVFSSISTLIALLALFSK